MTDFCPVLVRYMDGHIEAWGFADLQAAKSFLVGLSWHPELKAAEFNEEETELRFSYSGRDRATATIEPTFTAFKPGELTTENTVQHGEFDSTAIPMGGVPLLLTSPAPREFVPKRLRQFV